MDKITPLDLERARLPRGFRGYRPEAVDRLLLSASQQLEAQLVENRRLVASLKTAEGDLARFRAEEATLNSALVLAQKASDETRALARKEADLVVEQAKLEANETVRAARESVRALESETEALKSAKRACVAGFRSLLAEQLARLDEEAPIRAVLSVDAPEAATG